MTIYRWQLLFISGGEDRGATCELITAETPEVLKSIHQCSTAKTLDRAAKYCDQRVFFLYVCLFVSARVIQSRDPGIESRDPGICIFQSRNPGIGKEFRHCNPYSCCVERKKHSNGIVVN